MKDPERDTAFDRTVGRTLQGAAAGDDCPDAETLAAWSEDALRDHERSHVERHVSDCARCQMHLAAMARMDAAGEPRAADGRAFSFARGTRWLVPLAGAAAAAGLWFVVQPAPVAPTPSETMHVEAPAAPEAPTLQEAPPRRLAQPKPAPSVPVARQSRNAARKQESVAGDVAGNVPASPPPPVAAASPAPAAAPVEERLAMSGARAANLSDITGLKVERSGDGRVSWDAQSSALLARVTAGASPTPSVIWLAGRGGLVLLATDGQTWRRRPFPEPLDLTAIQASSAVAAAVTAADGRVFATSDGGETWLAR